jgi:hypothetical protein
MPPIVSPSQKAAAALRRAERTLRNWQDDPDSPRKDVDRMLVIIDDLRKWVQGHVLSDIERAERAHHDSAIVPPPSH